ncbi:MAG: hypothetical protein AAF694_08560, partial [Bacteroidota bacterium]
MDDVILLLRDYKAYLNTGIPGDFHLFGEWLKQKYADSQEYLTEEEEINRIGVDVMTSYLIGG